jgi:hypothetical protein
LFDKLFIYSCSEACPIDLIEEGNEKMGIESLDSLKVAELRLRLRDLGLKVSGNKADLKTRLQAATHGKSGDIRNNLKDSETTSSAEVDDTKENRKPPKSSLPASERSPLAPRANLDDSERNKGGAFMKDTKTFAVKRISQVPGAANTILTASAKKRKRRGMTNAVNNAMLELSKLATSSE